MAGEHIATPEEVGRHYDDTADVMTELMGEHLHCGYWDDAADDSSLADAAARFTDVMIEALPVGQAATVLDIGCGVGGPAIRLAVARGCRVHGITISPEQVRRAGELATAGGVGDRVTFALADAVDTGLPRARYDAAWAIESLFHMADRGRVLRETARLLRPGAPLLLTDFLSPDSADRQALDTVFGAAPPTEHGYRELLADAGFTVERVTDITEFTLQRTQEKFAEAVSVNRSDYAEATGQDLMENFERSAPSAPVMNYVLFLARRHPDTATSPEAL